MDRYMGWLYIALALLASGVVGAFVQASWQRKNEMSKRLIPRRWPLLTRPLVNSKERQVWTWLVSAFHDHHVMVKVPVTRFTIPLHKDESQRWFQILSGVYCTFTISTDNGAVVGCVDVPGRLGFSLRNQTLKHSLLSQCDLRYWVVDPNSLPNADSIRATFLGEPGIESEDRLRTASQFNESREHLKASLLRQRHSKAPEKLRRVEETRFSDTISHDPTRFSDTISHDPYESRITTSWGNDSFVTPLDSRYADLH
jgi:hypothetical protein